MPVELKDAQRFLEVAARARECRVRRSGREVKLKLSTPRGLYTFKAKPEEADELLKRLSCPVVKLGEE